MCRSSGHVSDIFLTNSKVAVHHQYSFGNKYVCHCCITLHVRGSASVNTSLTQMKVHQGWTCFEPLQHHGLFNSHMGARTCLSPNLRCLEKEPFVTVQLCFRNVCQVCRVLLQSESLPLSQSRLKPKVEAIVAKFGSTS